MAMLPHSQVVTQLVPRSPARQLATPAADAAVASVGPVPAGSAVRPPVPRVAQVVTDSKYAGKVSRYITPFSLIRDEDVDSSSLSLLNTAKEG